MQNILRRATVGLLSPSDVDEFDGQALNEKQAKALIDQAPGPSFGTRVTAVGRFELSTTLGTVFPL